MKIIFILIVFFTNFSICILFYMHMFQLNSYFTKKYMHWIKNNILKILLQLIVTCFAISLVYLKFDILSVTILIILIVYNFPIKKAKLEFKFTNRVKRMFITEFLICLLLFTILKTKILVYLFVLSTFLPFMCIISNFINSPIEFFRKRYYINQAKQILNSMPNLIVIGITGSYGKTSVKNFLAKILETKYEVLTTPKNYNTTMGIVKTIRNNLKPTHQIFICEMGATKPNDINKICEIVKPKYGIITSIGPQHLESFKSIETIINTKFELAQSIAKNNGSMFLNFNNEYLSKQILQPNYITYGIDDDNLNYNATNIFTSSKGSQFTVLDKKINSNIEFTTNIIGKHNVVNIMGAIALSNNLGISLKDCILPIKQLTNVEHRLQLISKQNVNIIDNSYNSNPISSKSALNTLLEFEGTKIIVTPGLVELGKYEKEYNLELGKFAAKICDYIFLVKSKQSAFILKGILSTKFNKNKIFNVKSPEDAVNKILSLNLNKINILLENDLPDNY